MGNKVFNNLIRVKFPYSEGKYGNTAYRPYAYDSDGDEGGFSTGFMNNVKLVHPNNTEDKYQSSYSVAKTRVAVDGKKRSFVGFKGTNGTKSLFSTANTSMLDANNYSRLNFITGSIPADAVITNMNIINKHKIVFDKGTLKFKDTDGQIYVAQGVRSSSSNFDFATAWSKFSVYGSPINFKRDFNNNGDRTFPLYVDDVYANDGYSNCMLIVSFHLTLSNRARNVKYSFYSFLPVSFYDLSFLNNKNGSNKWYVMADVSTGTPYDWGLGIYNNTTAISNSEVRFKKLYGNSYFNLSSGLIKDTNSAKGIHDVKWRTPNHPTGGTSGSFISNHVKNLFDYEMRENGHVRYNVSFDITSYYMSEMSYKYYMYGDGLSLWRSDAFRPVTEGNLDSYREALFSVKWYPYGSTIKSNEGYFSGRDYIV